KTLTLTEAADLVKAIEETFGVDASASAGAVVMAAPGGGGEAEEAAPEKTEFDLILKEVPKEKKIAVIKADGGSVRSAPAGGLIPRLPAEDTTSIGRQLPETSLAWLRRFGNSAPLQRVARAPAVAAEAKVDDIVDELKTLTLTEAAELVKAIEETFGVDASASAGAVVMAAPGGGGEAEEAAPEKTEFDLVLKEVPKEKKIAVIKAVRAITGLGLKDAKGLADNPGKILEGKPKEACEDALKQLEEAGATAVIE
ncbi:unnamed protein product, partial [Effrenium voratum]